MFIQIGNFYASFGIGGGGGGDSMFAFRTSDLSRSSTSTLADDPELVESAIAAGTYQFFAYLSYISASATPGFKWGWKIDNLPTFGQMADFGQGRNAGALFQRVNNEGFVAAPVGNTSSIAANEPTSLWSTGLIVVASTSVITLQWAQSSSNATATTLKQGSYFALTRMT